MSRPRLNWQPSLFIVMAVALAADPTAAESTRRAHRSQPVPTARAAPDMTGTIAPAKQSTAKSPTAKPPIAGAPAPSTADDEALPQPFNLPSAPRARMRTCGEKWQGIKMAGQAADETWREFATRCLADKSDLPAKGVPENR